MKIVLMTCGSRGDVQPMIALTLAIKAAGHDALLAGPPEKAAWADRLGISMSPFFRFAKQKRSTTTDLSAGLNDCLAVPVSQDSVQNLIHE